MSWNNRDAIVAPWINNNNSSSSSASSSTTNAQQQQQQQQPCKLLSLLSTRERVGGNCYSTKLSQGGLLRLVATNDGLAKASAWNPRRLQNMTLAIGPGTPASCVLPTVNSSSEDDDDDDDDEDEMFRVDSDDDEDEEEEDVIGDEGTSAADADGVDIEGGDDISENSSNFDDDDDDAASASMELLPSDAEEGHEYHFDDDGGRLVKDDNNYAREEAETEIARHLNARVTQSSNTGGGRNDDEDEDDDEDDGDDGDRPTNRGRTRRGRWEKRQRSILDALDGVGSSNNTNNNEEEEEEEEESDVDDDYHDIMDTIPHHHANIENENDNSFQGGDGSNNSSNNSNSSSSHDSAGLTARDRYNIHQVEQYIDHLENVHHRDGRSSRTTNATTNSRRAANTAAFASATNTAVANTNQDEVASLLAPQQQQQQQQREVSRSMKHGGCINTVSWLDCGWRISTVSHEVYSQSSNYHHYLECYNDDDYNDYANCYSRNANGKGGIVQPTSSTEYPTQLLTSGDDHLVKFWDVSSSMGSISPLAGGSATCTPFSSERMPIMRACGELVDSWKNGGCGHHSSSFVGGSNNNSHHRRQNLLPGIVHPLLTLKTGHQGNVFHATPVPHSLGKVATCAADGYLRLHDVEMSSPNNGRGNNNGHRNNRSNATTNSSSSNNNNNGDTSSAVIISPEYQHEHGEDDSSMYRFHNSLMCFSHHFLSPNVGLVCSERGLLHFDIRLPARSQKRGSLVPELSRTCKACYPWRLSGGGSSPSNYESGGNNNDELESAYVFAGGSGVDVGLYDLRMTPSGRSSASSSSNHNDDTKQVVQKYRPRALHNKSSSVAVSGIDLSKDKRELLVSYESDHVYTFPIFEGRDDPTLEDIDGQYGDYDYDDDDRKSLDKNKPVPELAAYGGHLNRLTFLKMAKYAGPNDEYICTGSDSGHAWIYEKKSGTVVSFIKADNSTCNGIQPHPSLPYFITYGIDSTAKLWRATTPVDLDVDDSDIGRFNYSKTVKYEKSIVAEKWQKARKGKEVDLDDDTFSFFPDETSTVDNDDSDHFLGVFIRSRFSKNTPFIGNDMMNLNAILAKNYFTCARSLGMGDDDDDDQPVKSGIVGLKRRVSLIKLRHQADRLGLEFDCQRPWIFKPKAHLIKLMMEEQHGDEEGGGGGDMVSYGCLADLIPDNPSDYIPFDKNLSNPPRLGGMDFNTNKYERYHLESSIDRSVTPVSRAAACPFHLGTDGADDKVIDKLDREASKQSFSMQSNEKLIKSSEERKNEYDPSQAWDILFQTVTLLKEAGNEALKASLPFLAARRYDKAINYCSSAYLEFPVGTADFLVEHQYVISKNGGYECRWNELLKTLIMVRLNLAMVYLRKEINDVKGAISQANLSLKELKPFATEKGAVLTGKKLAKKRTDEPHSTFTEAKALEAKAYFRLGSAQLAVGECDDAVKTFEHCVESTKDAGMTVDAGVLRKINEAKRFRKEKKERHRKKFKFMFSSSSKHDGDSKNDDA